MLLSFVGALKVVNDNTDGIVANSLDSARISGGDRRPFRSLLN
jgi:hypothetical protein